MDHTITQLTINSMGRGQLLQWLIDIDPENLLLFGPTPDEGMSLREFRDYVWGNFLSYANRDNEADEDEEEVEDDDPAPTVTDIRNMGRGDLAEYAVIYELDYPSDDINEMRNYLIGHLELDDTEELDEDEDEIRSVVGPRNGASRPAPIRPTAQMRQRLDTATALLCGTMKLLMQQHPEIVNELPDGATEWMSAHLQEDSIRVSSELKVQRARLKSFNSKRDKLSQYIETLEDELSEISVLLNTEPPKRTVRKRIVVKRGHKP